jgi:flavin-dependent dehydrogenase
VTDLWTTEVLVVGAGPAGAVTALALARQGIDTVLVGDDDAGPGYDVVLSAPAQRALATVGALGDVPLEPAAVDLRLGLGAGPGRPLADAGAAVCDRRRLTEALRHAAMAAGATFVRGRVANLERDEDEIHHASIVPTGEVVADHVVLATGAGAGVDAGAGPGPLTPAPSPPAVGLAVAQRFRLGTAAAGDRRIVLVLPPPATIDPQEQPTCVWLLPGVTEGLCTIGASRLGEGYGAEELIVTALDVLHDLDVGQPVGPLASGPIDSGFVPAQAVHGGRLLIGDAAGLVNPFTGEGLSSALQSGLLAARSIADRLDDPVAAARVYGHRLATTFVGHFETARHAARRYHLAWRVLAATAASDRPLFAKARRAVLMPDGLAGLTADERMDLPAADAALLGPFLVACDEVAITTVRGEWPFLTRLLVAGDVRHARLRPAVLFFAGLAAGSRDDGVPVPVTHATVGAAIELATLGALAFLGPEVPGPEDRIAARTVDWATATTVLAGDFLLSQASRLVAEAAPEASWSFADWLAELTALRSARLDPVAGSAGPTGSTGAAADLFAALLEFPARLGGQLGGAPPEVVRALRDAGHHCGRATLYADDVLALRGERTRLDATLRALLESRISTLPDLLDDPTLTADDLTGSAVLHASALSAVVAACRSARQDALGAVAGIPHPAAARILHQFVTTTAAPADPDPTQPGRDRRREPRSSR